MIPYLTTSKIKGRKYQYFVHFQLNNTFVTESMNVNRLNFNLKQFQTKNSKGVFSLLAGNTISKVILILGGLYLAKWYGPENYGVYNVFLSYVLILPALSSLQLDNVLMLQKGSKDVRNVFSGTVLITAFFTCLIIALVSSLKALGIISVALPQYILVLSGIGGILAGWNLSQNAMFTKYKLFKQISTAFIIASLFSVVFQFLFYILGWTENGLIYGWLVGLTASFLYNLRVSKNRWNRVDVPAFKESVKEHKNILKYHYTSTAINTVANNILPILVLAYFGKLEVGVYGMALKVLSTPLVLMSSSVSKVYFQKATQLYYGNRKQLQKLTYKISISSFLVILAFVLLINTVGIYILEMIYSGDEWIGLRKYTLILSVWILARSAINPIANIMVVINRNQYSLIFNVYLLIVNLIAIFVGVYFNRFDYCLYIFVGFSSLGYFAQLVAILIDLNKLAKNEK